MTEPIKTPTDAELQALCAEILDWRKTGVLKGEALRSYAELAWSNDDHGLQMAERDVETAAMAAIARWGTAPTGEPVAWRYVPSPVWKDAVLTDDPERAQDARTIGCVVEPLYLRAQQTKETAKATPIAVLRREIGESSWFDHKPVRPGSLEHAYVERSPEWDYCLVFEVSPQPAEPPRAPQPMPDLTQLTERGATAWAGVDAQALREGRARLGEKEGERNG